MAVLFDTNILMLVLQPDALPPIDPSTGKVLDHVEERITYLIKRLSKSGEEVLVPTPALTEVLCKAGTATTKYIRALEKEPFRIAPFNTRAAIDCAELIAFHLARKPKGQKGAPGARSKINFDRQIVSIGKSNSVDIIYSDDEDVYKEATRVGLQVIRSFELELDPSKRQHKLEFEDTQGKASPPSLPGTSPMTS